MARLEVDAEPEHRRLDDDDLRAAALAELFDHVISHLAWRLARQVHGVGDHGGELVALFVEGDPHDDLLAVVFGALSGDPLGFVRRVAGDHVASVELETVPDLHHLRP